MFIRHKNHQIIVSCLEQSFLSWKRFGDFYVLWVFPVVTSIILIHLFILVEVACVQTIKKQDRLKPLSMVECWSSILLLQVKFKTNMSECKCSFNGNSNITLVKIFETNFRFHLKQSTVEKVQYLPF